MNVSSRWCVTAVFALGALACSDPVPPPAQGAFIASVKPASPPPVGKSCPAAAFTYDVPNVWDTKPAEVLDADTFMHKIIDGESGASVSCSVKGGSTFSFSGNIQLGVKGLEITNGTLDASLKGTARITVKDRSHLSAPLVSPGGICTIDAAKAPGNNYQVQPGSMWAKFDCSSVEAIPNDSCRADGYFVLENCEK